MLNIPTLVSNVQNHKPARERPDFVEKLISKEVQANRIAGPFSQKPFENLHISPLSIREKKVPNTYRLIHDLASFEIYLLQLI